MKSEKIKDFGQMGSKLDGLIKVMAQSHGLDVSFYNESFLVKSLEKRLQTTSETAPAYLARLSEDGAEAETFYRSLRIGYSDFFRNPTTFALLEQQILPGLVEKKARNGQGEIRIWSAGCSAGQEAWSVAILLDEQAAACKQTVPFRIFGTDLSEADLAFARTGVYSAAAVGNVRLRHLNSCFTLQGDTYAISSRIKSRVDFSVYDLLDANTSCPPASIYGDFDLVLCSNVLIYYQPKAQHIILDKLRQSLAAGGYLITGETERQIFGSAGGFIPAAPHVSVFQVKGH
jgi:chemotaxis protein methyltransferase CheR